MDVEEKNQTEDKNQPLMVTITFHNLTISAIWFGKIASAQVVTRNGELLAAGAAIRMVDEFSWSPPTNDSRKSQ